MRPDEIERFFAARVDRRRLVHDGRPRPRVRPADRELRVQPARRRTTAPRCTTSRSARRTPGGRATAPTRRALMLEHAFTRLDLHRVALSVFSFNERAIRAYRKAGFVVEGRAREAIWRDGRFWDEITMSVLEREWQATAAAGSRPVRDDDAALARARPSPRRCPRADGIERSGGRGGATRLPGAHRGEGPRGRQRARRRGGARGRVRARAPCAGRPSSTRCSPTSGPRSTRTRASASAARAPRRRASSSARSRASSTTRDRARSGARRRPVRSPHATPRPSSSSTSPSTSMTGAACGSPGAVNDLTLTVPAGQDLRPRRAVGLRQDDVASRWSTG